MQQPTDSQPRVEAIFIAANAAGPMREVRQATAVAGRGLEGDRYFSGAGTWSSTSGTGRDLTLIEAEAIEAIRAEGGIDIGLGGSRRNVVTSGVALNHLVGREFDVGEVRLRGVRLCEPCNHLSKLAGHGLVQPLLHRAGLRADIVRGGTLRPGDVVSW